MSNICCYVFVGKLCNRADPFAIRINTKGARNKYLSSVRVYSNATGKLLASFPRLMHRRWAHSLDAYIRGVNLGQYEF